MFGAPRVGRNNVGFYWDERFDNHIFDSMHYGVVIDANLFEVLFKLGQIPLWSIHSLTVLLISSTAIFDIIITFLVYGIVCQMDVPFVCCLLRVGIFLSRKANQTLFEKVDFQGIKAGDQCIDSQIVFKSVN